MNLSFLFLLLGIIPTRARPKRPAHASPAARLSCPYFVVLSEGGKEGLGAPEWARLGWPRSGSPEQ